MTSQRGALGIIGGALGIFLSATTSPAATIYTYTGQNYTEAIQVGTGPNVLDTSMKVTGSFSLASPLPANMFFVEITADVLNFSFFNGHDTLTPANANFVHFAVQTFAGQITDWDIILTTSSSLGTPFSGVLSWNASFSAIDPFDEGTVLSQCTHINAAGRCDNGNGGDARNSNQPGTWSVSLSDPAATPLPAALPLFVGGLGLIGLLARRRKRKTTYVAVA